MAEINDVQKNVADNDSQKATEEGHATTNGKPIEMAEEAEQGGETIFSLAVNLPREPKKVEIMVSTQEQVNDIRQSIMELPASFQYSCFHLEHRGERINDFIQLCEVRDLTPESELSLVEDPYTEKEARIHFIRVRELIGAAGDRTDTLQGILCGLSLHDSIDEGNGVTNGSLQSTQNTSQPFPLGDYNFSSEGSLATLLPRTQTVSPKTVKAISVSPWNPPPYHLRQKGHLLYLQVTTNEGDQYQITSHVGGFYVNKSSNAKFDPFPRATPRAHAAHSLLSLISELSTSFDESFKKLQEANNEREPLSTFQISNAIPASPWAVPSASSPIISHSPDITRPQEAYLISGIENPETLRDWNEEFQSTRELPKETAQERVFRERLTSKLFADYNDAAARGALLVARGEIAPLNPTEGRDAQIYVYNNVFFSYGADGVGTFASEGGDEAARVATGKDVMGVKMVNRLDIDGLFTPGTIVVDYLGKRIVGQSIVPGIFKQRDVGENQIDYGAVDGKEEIASDERFVPVFEKLSKALKVKKHGVWDKTGKRHELEGSVETKGLLGTDGRKYVLDLYRITPLDILWMEEYGTATNYVKQVNGTSEAPYPHRMTVLRPELVDSYWKVKMRQWVNGEVEQRRQKAKESGDDKTLQTQRPGSTDTTGVQSGKSADADPKEGSKEKSDLAPELSKMADLDNERIDISDFSFALNPDAFSGQEPQTEAEREEWTQDEQEVRSAAEFLRSTVIPDLIRDLRESEVGCPMDGESLSRLLHRRGINMRYLGKLATLADGKQLNALRVLSIQEMVSRSFKHIAGGYLRYLPGPFASACIAHLLNCLLGTGLNPKPLAVIDDSLKDVYPEADLAFKDVTPERLRSEIEIQVAQRYRFALGDAWHASIKPLQLLREVSLRLGLQIEAKEYRFTDQISSNGADTAVHTNGTKDLVPNGPNGPNGTSTSTSKKKKKAARDGSPAASNHSSTLVTFVADDILNVVPIIKEASPKSALAEEALEAGRISIMQGQKKLGQDLLLESLSLHEQIYGILHPEVARVYNTLSMLYYQLEEKEAAIELARKAVIVSERTLGVDSAETLLSYLNLGLFGHANGETTMALAYIRHALELWKVIYGPNHPDSITTINNAAVMLQHLKLYHESRLWFEASLNICENVFGKQSVNTATLLFQLAQALALDNDSKGSVNRMRESYNIFLSELGPKDKNTKEAESWLEQLTHNAVSIAKQAKDTQARRLRAGIRIAPRVTLGQTRPQPQVGQTAEASSGRDPQNVMGLNSRSIDELLKFIEGTDKKKTPKKRPGHSNPKRRGDRLQPLTKDTSVTTA